VYTQEIVCPSCGKMTNVNVPDSGHTTTPCQRWSCSAKIKVVVDEKGRITEIKDDSCIIATACIEAAGKGDDCRELTVLRAFRDWYLRERPEGTLLIAEYYKVAPVLLRKINSRSNRAIIWQDIFSQIRSAVELIEVGEREAAIACYRGLIENLQVSLSNVPIEVASP